MVSGLDTHRIPESVRPSLIAGLFDDTIAEGSTIYSYLRAGRRGSDRQLLQACADAEIGDWVKSLPLGLRTHRGRGATGFALHQRRLLALARLLVSPPRILILDGTLDILDGERARRVAESVASRVDVVILLTARRDIVPLTYRQLVLAGGLLSQDR